MINGSVNNAATSRYSLAQAFGNRRARARNLYNGSLAAAFGNSALDARPYSLTGLQIPKDSYNRFTGLVTFGGPIRVPPVLYHGPNFFVSYQWTRNTDASTSPGLVPTIAQRTGDLSGTEVFDPATGQPLTGLLPVPQQAKYLLNLYPLPNVAGNTRYNYQTQVLANTHQDALQTRLDKSIGHRDQLNGGFAFRSTRGDSANLFGFRDTTDVLGINTNINWHHQLRRELYLDLGYKFSRLRTRITPNFASRQNISGLAGITGNNQNPENWGPPALSFSSGISALSDSQSAFNRNRTDGLSYALSWNHNRHNFTFGGDFRRQEFNYFSQQDPRGSFSFTGAATQGTVNGTKTGGSDIADFLLGIPDTSSIAYGNADKYFRQSVYDLYANDDWRVRPDLTINAGLRWEYGAPLTELFGRLVNLDIASGFAAATPVLGNDPLGAITGRHYPSSLIHPDRSGLEPRIGISWRPLPASTLVLRGSYGIYHDTSVYEATTLDMAQQAPLSKSLNVQNSASCALTLANGFRNCGTTTPSTFAVDPHFRVGYAQIWRLSAQRDLPFAMQMTATYLGTKGTHGVQEYLPNTNPIGADSLCPDCPVGFRYRTSGGNSIRHAADIQLRRRLRSGFTAMLQYTFAKAVDNDAVLGGQGHTVATSSGGNGNSSSSDSSSSASQTASIIAQNWRNLRAERGPSTFDQRHLLSGQLQYTTGMGVHGGSLMTGWSGRLLKDWTVLSRFTVGSGLPENPIYFATVPDTSYTTILRPDRTGESVTQSPAGLHLNPAAYRAPASGQWGNAGRNSITGPGQFSLDSALARTFRVREHWNLDFRIDASNLLNHVVFTSWNSTVNSATFGEAAGAGSSRNLQTTMRLRF